MAEKTESKKVKKANTIEFRVAKEKNFVGFMHPKTKKFITANENNEFVVSEDDKEAIEILERAADTFKV